MATMSAVDLFRQYIRIRTDHPQPDYQACIEFLTAYLTQRVGIAAADIRIVHATDANKPSLFATIHGSDRSLPSILLNSHTDVVPVDRSRWTVEPFDGVQQPDTRRIYGRGTQDMKCVTIQYLEALRTLLHKQQSGELPKVCLAYHNTYMHLRRWLVDWQRRHHQQLRTIHISFVPDEEIGGKSGLGAYAFTREFDQVRLTGVESIGCGVLMVESSWTLGWHWMKDWPIRPMPSPCFMVNEPFGSSMSLLVEMPAMVCTPLHTLYLSPSLW
jgi:aminoacylase